MVSTLCVATVLSKHYFAMAFESFHALESCHTQDVETRGGRFKGGGPSAWAAVNTAHRWGTNSEQSSALLIGAK